MTEENHKKDVTSELNPEGIFSLISQEDLETLKFYGTCGEFGTGEVVVEEGHQQDRLYYILSGSLEVLIGNGQNEVSVGCIGAGDCIGEVSIFEPGPASATVRVAETAILWHINVLSLQEFFEKVPTAGGQLMVGIAQLLCKRLRHANQAILEHRILPKHLNVRSGKASLTAENLELEESLKPSGIFNKLMKKQNAGISKEIKL